MRKWDDASRKSKEQQQAWASGAHHLRTNDIPQSHPTNERPSPLAYDPWQAVCEMVSISGKKLTESSEESRKKLKSYMNRMEKIMGDKALPSRLRFIIKDLLELDKAKWVPRRETFTGGGL